MGGVGGVGVGRAGSHMPSALFAHVLNVIVTVLIAGDCTRCAASPRHPRRPHLHTFTIPVYFPLNMQFRLFMLRHQINFNEV